MSTPNETDKNNADTTAEENDTAETPNSSMGDNVHGLFSDTERHDIACPTVGSLTVFAQGTRSSHEVVILTVHDLGCDHTMYTDFVLHPKMTSIRDRTVWVHVNVPGQDAEAADLPADYVFPKMQTLGEELIHVLDQLKIKEVICFGEGAGANILSRFAMAYPNRILGCIFLHCTGSSASLMESLKDKVISWKLDHVGVNPTAESYLVLHRYGAFHSAEDEEQLKNIIENFQSNLRTKANKKNLKKFVETFLKRTTIAEQMGNKIKCPILFLTGQKSVFNGTTRNLYNIMMKKATDKGKVEFIEIAGVANILEERPNKIVESFQYFLQGCGLISSVPMHHIGRPHRNRSMSMEEYDMPKLSCRSMSASGSPLKQALSTISSSPPK